MNLEASVFSLWLRNETKGYLQYFSPYMKQLKALARPGLREKKKNPTQRGTFKHPYHRKKDKPVDKTTEKMACYTPGT